MISFENDYNTGCHEEILKRLTDTNLEPCSGYGADPYSSSAKEKIREAINMPSADVEFIVGGTQTNMTVISTLLNDYEGVISADTGHVSTHEAGAIEYSGHKVLYIPHENGKLSADAIRTYLETYYADGNHEHMVCPGMVYISYPTEFGTLYSKKELEAIYALCNEYKILLYIDGARLSYGLNSKSADLTLPEIARLCDVMYIGGTKVGALCGEAVVYTSIKEPTHMIARLKQRGALLAKGRLLGIQFDTLFTDNLYMRIGAHAMDKAYKLMAVLKANGYKPYIDSPTNQQYIVMENSKMEELAKSIAFSFWETIDKTHTAIRLVTTWSTTDEDIEALDKALRAL